MQVYLFPLMNVTLFPRTTKPLNIFEPRYLQMMEDAVQKNIPVALAYVEDPNAIPHIIPGQKPTFVREIAGYGHPQIVERRANGTIMVFLRGEGKIRLQSVVAPPSPYVICEGEALVESEEVFSENRPALKAMFQLLVNWIRVHIPDPEQQDFFMKNIIHPVEVVGAFATYLIRDYDMQQMVFEFTDINQKIDFILRLIQSGEITH